MAKPPAKPPAKPAPKKTGGKPTLYRPEMCETAIEVMAQGYSLGALAGHLGVSRRAVINWRLKHPEFAEATAIGAAKSQKHWETLAITLAREGAGNPAAIIFGLKNRAGEDWVEQRNVAMTGANGGPVQVQTIDPAKLSTDALREIMGAAIVAPEPDAS